MQRLNFAHPKKINFNSFIASVVCIIYLAGCTKEIDKQPQLISEINKKITLPVTTNPYSKRNIEKAKISLAKKNNQPALYSNRDGFPEYVYFKFLPERVTAHVMRELENDSIVKLLDFPFANFALYTDSFNLDEARAAELNDGSVYGITSIDDPLLALLVSNTNLQTNLLDTLTLIPEMDTALQFQALLEAGVPQAQIDAYRRRFCFFKRPHGFVRYQDNELGNGNGRLEPVRNISVWALAWGIPIHTYTDNNGYYSIPFRFSVGTIMGTLAKNTRVNVKPINTVGGWVISTIFQTFIVGSVHVKGWVSSCNMRNDVNFDFVDHKQNRFWSMLLNAYAFNDQFTTEEGIGTAPYGMICYAHWKDAEGFGNASCPLFGHLNYISLSTETILNNIFGADINLSQNYPNVLNLLTGVLPDNYVSVCGVEEPERYCSRLAQIEFHELGHAIQFLKVGERWHEDLIRASIRTGSGGYGNPGERGWGNIQVGESWAEYIGTENARRRYGDFGFKRSVWAGNLLIPFTLDNQENEEWFFSNWIPSGVYWDLIDQDNLVTENWDEVAGSSISDMYRVFTPNTGNMCTYWEQFTAAYPQLNPPLIRAVFTHYRLSCF